MKISATIIVRNEEHNIADVCETVSWADEILIVDSDSTDKTVDIARKYTDKIFNREWNGYKDKHEYADAQTSGDWIFWIDADERVTPELRASIERLRNLTDDQLADGYKIARKTEYLDRWIMHSGWYPDYQMRLYRKEKSYWDGVAPHQTARVDGRIEKLEGEFLHYTKRDLSEHHRVTDSYASLAAEHMAGNGKTIGAFGILSNAIAAFLRTYFLKQGFRDGVPGMIIAGFTAYGVFLKYAKLWEINIKK
ncbi:MAG TPA: glycosyltransferase family 2 protein [Pyrinomonadaceae bacterium]|nr:glycosyltransferase family 2 protein [Acidobacteriota bacterium]HQZ95168.1 glycosyltransferase family 2 protein [Pyrinomonadaceae bacterium]